MARALVWNASIPCRLNSKNMPIHHLRKHYQRTHRALLNQCIRLWTCWLNISRPPHRPLLPLHWHRWDHKRVPRKPESGLRKVTLCVGPLGQGAAVIKHFPCIDEESMKSCECGNSWIFSTELFICFANSFSRFTDLVQTIKVAKIALTLLERSAPT